jgi:hypothetical protein
MVCAKVLRPYRYEKSSVDVLSVSGMIAHTVGAKPSLL